MTRPDEVELKEKLAVEEEAIAALQASMPRKHHKSRDHRPAPNLLTS